MTEKILVIKHGALGDVVQGFDAFASLRYSFTHAEVTALTTTPYAELLSASGWFDNIILDPRASVFNLRQLSRIRAVLREPWSKIIDLQCSRRTERYARFIGSGTRWFGTAQSATDRMPDFTGVNNRNRMLTAVTLAGAKEHQADLTFLENADSPAEAIGSEYAFILPGTSVAKLTKRWPVERFVRLADAFAERGIRPVLGGSQVDRPVTSAIASACPACLDLTGQTDLFALAGAVARARCVVGNDTGPVFLAARLHTPTLMLMGADTDPEMSAPYGRHAKWLKQNKLDDLSFNDVWASVLMLLEG